MKATRLVPGKVLNPAYDAKAHRKAIQSNEAYDQTKEIEVDADYVYDHPDCWVLCCPGFMNSTPTCEPADDECRAKVAEWMTEKRPAQLRNIQNQLDNLKAVKDPDHRKHITRLAAAYGLKPGGDPSPAPAPAADKPDKPAKADKTLAA